MSDTTTTELVTLYSLRPGDTFYYRGTHYVLTGFNRTRVTMATVAHPVKRYTLAASAKVQRAAQDLDALSRALVEQETVMPTLRVGTKVRIVTNTRTSNAGLAGMESVIVKVNGKTYGLANGVRISPNWVTEV